jgi:hypothetical protein
MSGQYLTQEAGMGLYPVKNTRIFEAHHRLRGLTFDIVSQLSTERGVWVDMFFLGEAGAGKTSVADHFIEAVRGQPGLNRLHVRRINTGAFVKAGRELGAITSPHVVTTAHEFGVISQEIYALGLYRDIENAGRRGLRVWELNTVYGEITEDGSVEGPDLGTSALRRLVGEINEMPKRSAYADFVVTNNPIQKETIVRRNLLVEIAKMYERGGYNEKELRETTKELLKFYVDKDFDYSPENIVKLARSMADGNTIQTFRRIMDERIACAAERGVVGPVVLEHLEDDDNLRRSRQSQLYKSDAPLYGFLPGHHNYSYGKRVGKRSTKPNSALGERMYTTKEIELALNLAKLPLIRPVTL